MHRPLEAARIIRMVKTETEDLWPSALARWDPPLLCSAQLSSTARKNGLGALDALARLTTGRPSLPENSPALTAAAQPSVTVNQAAPLASYI
jgi:hypothetical protein